MYANFIFNSIPIKIGINKDDKIKDICKTFETDHHLNRDENILYLQWRIFRFRKDI